MYHIVIPIDEDETRARTAAEFVADLGDESGLDADLGDVSVSIVNVFKEFQAVDEGGNVQSRDLYDEDEFPDSVVTARDLLAAAGVAVDVERRHGDPAEEIIDYAESVDADTIVIPDRKRSPVGKAVFGSVTQDVILDADRPVTVGRNPVGRSTGRDGRSPPGVRRRRSSAAVRDRLRRIRAPPVPRRCVHRGEAAGPPRRSRARRS